MKNMLIPKVFFKNKIKYISKEVFDRLNQVKPQNIGEAMYISGISAISINILISLIRRISK